MRFREMHQYLEAYKLIASNAPKGRRYTLRAALESLARVPALEKEASGLLDEQVFGGTGDITTTTVLFDRKLERLRDKAELLHEVIEGTLQDENENSVAVRIPSPNHLGELKDIVHELQQVFEHPVQAALGAEAGEVRLRGFDVGSEWIYIAYAAGVAPLMLVGHILRLANWWRDQTLEAERKRAQLNVDNIAVEALRTHAQVEKQLLELALAQQVREILSENGTAASGKSADQEIHNRMTKGVQVWADMLGRGATAVPALNASHEVKAAFPATPSFNLASSVGPKLLQSPPHARASLESPASPANPPDTTLASENDGPPQSEN